MGLKADKSVRRRRNGCISGVHQHRPLCHSLALFSLSVVSLFLILADMRLAVLVCPSLYRVPFRHLAAAAVVSALSGCLYSRARSACCGFSGVTGISRRDPCLHFARVLSGCAAGERREVDGPRAKELVRTAHTSVKDLAPVLGDLGTRVKFDKRGRCWFLAQPSANNGMPSWHLALQI